MHPVRAHYGGLFYTRGFFEHPLDILGIHVESFGRDDQIFLPPAHHQAAIRREVAKIAGVQPAVVRTVARGKPVTLVITAGHVRPANQDLAIGGDLHFHARDGLAHATFLCVKGMVEVTIGAVSVKP